MNEKIGKLKVCGNVQGNFKSTWVLENFSSLDSQVGKHYDSETFRLENGGIQWYVSIYPGGNKEEFEGYVCCSVNKKHETGRVNVKYITSLISFVNTKGDIIYNAQKVNWISVKHEHVTIERKSLLENLVDDTLIFAAEVSHCTTSVQSDIDIDRCVEITPLLKLADDLRNLWISKENVDGFISVGGEDIPVHSAILSARSKVFAAMFRHDTKEKETRRVEVTDFEKGSMISMMEFIYSGSVQCLDFGRALELLRASDRYEVSDLKLYCTDYLLSLLDNDNVCEIMLNADIYDAEKLRLKAIEYFCSSALEIDFSTERSVFETRPALLFDIVQQMTELMNS